MTSPAFFELQTDITLKKLNVPEGLAFRVERSEVPGVDRLTLYLVGLGQYVATDLSFDTHTVTYIESRVRRTCQELLVEFGEKLGERTL